MYRALKCFWCGAERYPFDDHWLWCSELPRDAITAALATKGDTP